MTSQLVIFRGFLIIFSAHNPKSEKKTRKSNNKNILALPVCVTLCFFREESSANLLPQSGESHTNGFSPEIRSCYLWYMLIWIGAT